jgi:hypothetical protein
MGRHRVVTGNEGRGCFIACAVMVLLFVVLCVLLAVSS